jgi:hypothetical protein
MNAIAITLFPAIRPPRSKAAVLCPGGLAVDVAEVVGKGEAVLAVVGVVAMQFSKLGYFGPDQQVLQIV